LTILKSFEERNVMNTYLIKGVLISAPNQLAAAKIAKLMGL